MSLCIVGSEAERTPADLVTVVNLFSKLVSVPETTAVIAELSAVQLTADQQRQIARILDHHQVEIIHG
ncbi:MAG: hypothetical protein ACOYUK_03960 [Patescibacteria group bacterium]